MIDDRDVDRSVGSGHPEAAGEAEATPDAAPAESPSPENAAAAGGGDADEIDVEAAMLKLLEELPQAEDKPAPEDINFDSASVSRAEFQQLQAPVAASATQNIELLMDVDLPISIELGRTRMSIADILSLGPGSVIELNKLAGEPVDLLVGHKVVARGEVVIVDENLGMRITQLMTPEERSRSIADD